MLTGGEDSIDIFSSFWYMPMSTLYANGQLAPLNDLLASDGQGILDLCQTNQVTLILVGIALSEDGVENPAMRHAQKVADKLRELTIIPVLLWDESGSTRQVKLDSLAAGVKRKDRHGHLDKNAAAVILRSYLERDVHEDTN